MYDDFWNKMCLFASASSSLGVLIAKLSRLNIPIPYNCLLTLLPLYTKPNGLEGPVV